MWSQKLLLVLVGLLHSHQVSSLWHCTNDADCSSTDGAVCLAGDCVCPAGQQLVLGGSRCAPASPYLTSTCVEDHQCSNLVTNFECRRTSSSEEGYCFCQEGFHYYRGRCWRVADHGAPCNRDEECMGVLRDPFSLTCRDGLCGCSDGYYERQRGECRKIGFAVGDGCVLDEDCQFDNGICNVNTFKCVDSSISDDGRADVSDDDDVISKESADTNTESFSYSLNTTRSTKQHGTACDSVNVCPSPFTCSVFGHCVCPAGYYANAAGTLCLAELGSPSSADQCMGFLAEVIDGVCRCPANIYYEPTMRDCVKATLRLTDACVSDQMCHTFGAAVRCTATGELPWQLRQCLCLPEQAVWDEQRSMCRLFVGIGESCQVNSDCLAGEMEIECEVNSEGQGVCVCPEGFAAVDGLCLTTGLQLGDQCQVTQECTETAHTVCYNGTCTCGEGYQEINNICAPTIGGTCFEDSDCTIENTVCVSDNTTFSCQCDNSFVEYNDVCWPELLNISSTCEVTAQCQALMGDASRCVESQCECTENYHARDERCWPQTGLFETCARTSECFLNDISERVVCRNSMCQCSFHFPYSEQLHTCTSSATKALSSISTIIIALFYVMS